MISTYKNQGRYRFLKYYVLSQQSNLRDYTLKKELRIHTKRKQWNVHNIDICDNEKLGENKPATAKSNKMWHNHNNEILLSH